MVTDFASSVRIYYYDGLIAYLALLVTLVVLLYIMNFHLLFSEHDDLQSSSNDSRLVFLATCGVYNSSSYRIHLSDFATMSWKLGSKRTYISRTRPLLSLKTLPE